MRLFIGLPITGDLFNSADAVRSEYQRHPATKGLHWSPESNWHLTLRFLGNCTDTQTAELIDAIKPIAEKVTPFELTSNGLLVLPPRKPRVFCLSVRLNDAMAVLYRNLHKASEVCGFAQEKRPFMPHITLGRWKNPELMEFNPHKPTSATATVDCCHLYESVPGEHNSEYKPIETFTFNG